MGGGCPPVEEHELDPERVAGVAVGIIHPFAVASDDEALVVSGRAIRAESRMHLDDTRQRGKHVGREAPTRGRRGVGGGASCAPGNANWRRGIAGGVRHAHHQAAKRVVAWAVDRKIGTLVVGDPERHHRPGRGCGTQPAAAPMAPHPPAAGVA
jgi:putative transposase